MVKPYRYWQNSGFVIAFCGHYGCVVRRVASGRVVAAASKLAKLTAGTTTMGANLPKYINDVSVGTKFWDVATFSSNEYLQMSAFNAGCSKSYFCIPVDFTAAKEILFKSKDGYNDGNPLRVYYSTNYIPGGSFEQATLIDITTKFRISTGNTDGYGSEFINSGVYSIPIAVTGNGFFIFEYDGTSGISTTIQLDDIIVR